MAPELLFGEIAFHEAKDLVQMLVQVQFFRLVRRTRAPPRMRSTTGSIGPSRTNGSKAGRPRQGMALVARRLIATLLRAESPVPRAASRLGRVDVRASSYLLWEVLGHVRTADPP